MTPAVGEPSETDGPSIREAGASSARPRKRRRPLLIALIVVGVLFLFVVAVAGGFYANFFFKVRAANHRVTPDVQQALSTPPPSTVTTVPQSGSQLAGAASADSAFNLLVLGSDARPGAVKAPGSADVIMILHIDQQRNFLSVLEITRDLWVDIPGYGKDRINAAYDKGGAARLITTLKQNLGIDITKYIGVGFDSFPKIVDSLGGVYVDVDRRYTGTPAGSIKLAPGYQLLDGASALLYTRYRFDENADFGRMARQQRVLAALRDEIAGRNLAVKMPGIVNTLLDSTATNLSSTQLINLGYWLVKLDGSRIKHVLIRAGGTMIDGKAVVVVDQATLTQAVTDFLTTPATSQTSGSGRAAVDGNQQAATDGDLQVAADTAALSSALAISATSSPLPNASMWKSTQAGVPFALEAPTYIPDGFSYAYKNPDGKGTYGIKVGGGTQPAVCMVYQYLKTSECLRVEATTWVAAPSASKGTQVVSNGVTYTIVGTSGSVDRVWWTTDGVLYCVANTLMHTVDKQDLLQMAESMTPVGTAK